MSPSADTSDRPPGESSEAGSHTSPAAVRVCGLSDLPSTGAGLQVWIEGREPLALWKVEDRIWATDDTCTHGKASLVNEGYLEGHVIECGMHQGCFDVRNGSVLAAPCRVPLRTYEVQVRGEDVYVVLGPDEK